MKKEDFNLILSKLDIKSDDVYSYEKNSPQQKVTINGKDEIVSGNIIWGTISTKSGKVYHFKMNTLSKFVKTIDEAGYEFMS